MPALVEYSEFCELVVYLSSLKSNQKIYTMEIHKR